MESRLLAVLGASGSVGRCVVSQALARGHRVRAQTRDSARLAATDGRIEVVEGAPDDGAALDRLVRESDAVLYLLGCRTSRPTTFFSDTTSALIEAMIRNGARRLIAVTGVGAGETRGHGGFFYDRVIFPLFTRQLYADKDRQEALIAASGLDWTIVRPAPFAAASPATPLEVHLTVGPDTVLRRITRDEVAAFVLDEAETGAYLRARPFIGHP